MPLEKWGSLPAHTFAHTWLEPQFRGRTQDPPRPDADRPPRHPVPPSGVLRGGSGQPCSCLPGVHGVEGRAENCLESGRLQRLRKPQPDSSNGSLFRLPLACPGRCDFHQRRPAASRPPRTRCPGFRRKREQLPSRLSLVTMWPRARVPRDQASVVRVGPGTAHRDQKFTLLVESGSQKSTSGLRSVQQTCIRGPPPSRRGNETAIQCAYIVHVPRMPRWPRARGPAQRSQDRSQVIRSERLSRWLPGAREGTGLQEGKRVGRCGSVVG